MIKMSPDPTSQKCKGDLNIHTRFCTLRPLTEEPWFPGGPTKLPPGSCWSSGVVCEALSSQFVHDQMLCSFVNVALDNKSSNTQLLRARNTQGFGIFS